MEATNTRFTSLENLEKEKLRGFGGTANYYRSSFFTNTIHTDGIETLCKEGKCYWLLDVLSTEFYSALKSKTPDSYYIKITVKDSKATIKMEDYTGKTVHKRYVPYTDLPEGKLTLYGGWDGKRLILCLISEH